MTFTRNMLLASISMTTALLTGCASTDSSSSKHNNSFSNEFYGTLNPYAAEQVYFLLTDRFVDGDPSNNHEDQGGEKYHTFNRPLIGPNGEEANVGYMGGDFKGVLNNAQYIKDMGFTSVWITPPFDNPDEAFSGGEEVTYGAYYKDGGKTGYHGYWGVNFFEVDEHYPSKDLSFADFTRHLKEDYDLNFVLDIVGNHGSPSYSMPVDQPKFGELYDGEGNLVADHQNIHPEKLDHNNPLHRFYNKHTGLAQLSDLNENNPAVVDYFEKAYLKWLAQGVHAIRVDTIKEIPHFFWKDLLGRLRKHYPDMFIFGESFSYDAEFIAEHTRPENGGVSVLDFPGKEAITKVFENPGTDYSEILSYLHLDDKVYQNPYELMTFYDNHDMTRMNATDEGFIDANNWLFTARGIPVIYYGSEMNFMTGKNEHEGNRNYFGQERIEQAKKHPVQNNLTRIAHVRKNNIALQRGLQINLDFTGDKASFYRVYQNGYQNQTALVMLNKGDKDAEFVIKDKLSHGLWLDAFSKKHLIVDQNTPEIKVTVPAHGVSVWVMNNQANNKDLIKALQKQQDALGLY
ncbi:cyclomaltodextrin glucanotransferase [Paraneptunicella aestuarii]|uniref:alpha-amylase family glycosyl hydrolase n=1 Tax=Paraneptunicella aestuarii TaxID=2831148 RepID=UPI001E2AD6DB|nr:alpha-amylase family glycosyl hydrolase [Paraneptunicella aestuarii]UAA39743.1 cyclomaltodextrin glucanotransferase [Paraneptunicella aestuarii]